MFFKIYLYVIGGISTPRRLTPRREAAHLLLWELDSQLPGQTFGHIWRGGSNPRPLGPTNSPRATQPQTLGYNISWQKKKRQYGHIVFKHIIYIQYGLMLKLRGIHWQILKRLEKKKRPHVGEVLWFWRDC